MIGFYRPTMLQLFLARMSYKRRIKHCPNTVKCRQPPQGSATSGLFRYSMKVLSVPRKQSKLSTPERHYLAGIIA